MTDMIGRKPAMGGAAKAAWYGVTATVVVGGILAWAGLKDTGGFGPVVVAPVALGAGLALAAFSALRLRAVRAGSAIGLAIGAASAVELLVQDVAAPFLPAAAALGFFAVIGFILGGTIEFTLFIHHLAHGGLPSDYPKS